MVVATKVPTVGYDKEFEKMRLKFEMRKFETEMEAAKLREEREKTRRKEDIEREEARRREEMEAAKLKEEREKTRRRADIEREEARRREEMEAVKLRGEIEETRWRQERELQEQELHVHRGQWEWQRQRDANEGAKQKTPAAQVKFFGNVLQNVMLRFPSDVADVSIFFEGVEKLFQSFEVLEELKSKLLLPYLSDEAKSLLLRLDAAKQDRYSEVNAFY